MRLLTPAEPINNLETTWCIYIGRSTDDLMPARPSVYLRRKLSNSIHAQIFLKQKKIIVLSPKIILGMARLERQDQDSVVIHEWIWRNRNR